MQDPIKWKKLIVKTYGGIHKLDDRTTISIMLDRTKEDRAKIAEFIDLSKTFPGVLAPDAIQRLKNQDAELEVIQQELEEWERKSTPWDDCKVAFSINDVEALNQGWDDLKNSEDLPQGWSAIERNSSGGQHVIIFQIEGMPRKADAQRVKRLLESFQNKANR